MLNVKYCLIINLSLIKILFLFFLISQTTNIDFDVVARAVVTIEDKVLCSVATPALYLVFAHLLRIQHSCSDLSNVVRISLLDALTKLVELLQQNTTELQCVST